MLFIGLPSALAVPLTVWRRSSLEQHFAKAHFTTVKQLAEFRVYDLKQVPGVTGFTLGRFTSKSNKATFGGAVLYCINGKKFRTAAIRLGAAKRVRAMSIIDLHARESTISPQIGSWLAARRGTVKEPPRAARWPVLTFQTEQLYSQHLKQEVHLISLKHPERPELLKRISTLSTWKGEGKRSRGRRPSRFNGTRVTSLRLLREKGKPLRLRVMEQRISTRFNRCLEPESEPIIYEYKDGRFIQQPRKGGLGGCR